MIPHQSPDPDQEPDFQLPAKLLDETYEQERVLAHLRNSVLDPDEGFLTTIKKFVSKISRLTSLNIALHVGVMNRRLDHVYQITVFRIIQELVANVIKHAKAGSVTIDINFTRHSLYLSVSDDGVGFDNKTSSSGMGLYSIQMRVKSLGGHVHIESFEKRGTTVTIDVPIPLVRFP